MSEVKPEDVPYEAVAALREAMADPVYSSTRAAIAAALNAWPDARKTKAVNAVTEDLGNFLLLPLVKP